MSTRAPTQAAGPPIPTHALLRQFGRRFAADYQHRLAEGGYRDLTVAQTQMLPLIGVTGRRITDIAALAGVTKQTVALIVNQLEVNGYTRRIADPEDARAKLVELTGRGHQALAAIRGALAAIDRQWAETLNPRRLQQFRDALNALLVATPQRPDP